MTRVSLSPIPRYMPRSEDREDEYRNERLHHLESLEDYMQSSGYRPEDVRTYNRALTSLGFTKS